MKGLSVERDLKLLKRLSLSIPLLVTVVTSPLVSYDPINLPKFSILITLSSIILFILFFRREVYKSRINRTSVFLSLVFIAWLLISLIGSKTNLTESVFGVTGRQTGVLSYISFILIMLATIICSERKFYDSLLKILIISGLTNACYGLIQSIDGDPFDWVNPYSPVFGFFGNPNFHSSFMGITSTAALALILKKNYSVNRKIIYLLIIILAFINIIESESQQGFLVFATGASVVLFLWLKYSNYVIIKKIYFLIWILGIIGVVLDILQKSPWASILYEESVSFRGDFWRAGWGMTMSNPIFGVGLDGYRDHFRTYRDQVAINRDASAMVDSAHNVFLDISTGGGFPLLFIYLLILFQTLRSSYKVMKRIDEFDPLFAGILGCWLAYMAQSLISINQIALAVWGWVLMGALIAYEFITRNTEPKVVSPQISQATAKYISIIIIAFLFGTLATAQSFYNDVKFRSSVESGDIKSIEESVFKWPQSVIRMTLAAKILREGGFPDQALGISINATERFSENFEAWEELALNPKVSENLKINALIAMKKLDPLNSNID